MLPTLAVTLRKGDRLYLPFGTIHRAVPEKGFPSVHITFEFHADGFTWGDLVLRAANISEVRAT